MKVFQFVAFLAALALIGTAQNLSPNWEELTAEDFVKALDQAKGVCILPFGIIEKHGPSGPMGTDLLNVRYATFEAVKKEYAIVFPEYYFGQIFEAKHQPGTIAYSTHLQLELLQETTAEMGRNGCKKVAIVSGHGGNTNLIQFFAQTTLETPKDYVVDGASIPRALWTLVGSPYTGDYRRASIVHDKACDEAVDDPPARRAADRMFYHACRAGGCSIQDATVLYIGVRMGGVWPQVTPWSALMVAPETPQIDKHPTNQRIEADFRMIAHQVLAEPETDDPAEIESRTDRALSSTTGLKFQGR